MKMIPLKNRLALLFAATAVVSLSSCSSDDDGDSGCTETIWYQDADDDGLGNPEVSISACEQPDGYVENSDDEDDTDATNGGTTVACESVFFINLDASECTVDIEAELGIASSYVESIDGTVRTITVNNIPNHLVGTFPNAGNPNVIYSDNDADNPLINTYTMTTEPVLASNVTSTGGHVSGVLFSGVGLEVQTNETYVNTATGTANRDWNLVALQDARDLGLDCNNAHVQPTGQYHYHAAPTAYVSDLGVDGTAMVKLGYAGDGFPIYYKYGYADDGVTIMAFESGYSLIEGDRGGDGGDTPDGCYDGSYSQDYEFIAMNSELDQCNGRTGKTPESDSEYYYVMTDNYPSAPICFSGTPDNSFRFGGGGM